MGHGEPLKQGLFIILLPLALKITQNHISFGNKGKSKVEGRWL